MRVQVTRESAPGSCATPTCRFSILLTSVNRYVVFLGTSFAETDWLCDECIKDKAQDMAFEIEPPKIDNRAPPDRRMKRTSRRRELEVAEAVGGRRQPGSGNQPFAKGDVRKKGEFRVELKECMGLEFKVHSRDLLDKIRSECSPGEQPAVVVTFRDKITHQELDSWAMVPFEVWEKYTNAPRPNR